MPIDDHPTLWDGLDRSSLIREVADLVTSAAPPLVVGVYGDWGSGKTSFLRQLEYVLTLDCESADVKAAERAMSESARVQVANDQQANQQVADPNLPPGRSLYNALIGGASAVGQAGVIWFDAWHYQNEPAPIVALLHEIRSQISGSRKFAGALKKAVHIVIESAALSLGTMAEAIGPLQAGAKFIGAAIGHVSKSAEKYEQRNLETELSTDQIQRLLSYSFKQVLDQMDFSQLRRKLGLSGSEPKEEARRLVIVVDDLDRCEPEMAIKLLEGIKVFLNLPNCVFVLGLNERRLTDHIAALYKASDGDSSDAPKCRHRAKDYLEKIIIRKYQLGLAWNVDKLVSSSLGVVKPTGPNNTQVDISSKVLDLLKRPHVLPPNPRKIKGMLATLARYNSRRFSEQPNPQLLVLFAYLNHFQPEIVRKMAYYPDYAVAFFQWASQPSIGLDNDFDGMYAPPESIAGASDANSAADDTRFRDPIDDNILHPLSLARDYWELNRGSFLQSSADISSQAVVASISPYILLA